MGLMVPPHGQPNGSLLDIHQAIYQLNINDLCLASFEFHYLGKTAMCPKGVYLCVPRPDSKHKQQCVAKSTGVASSKYLRDIKRYSGMAQLSIYRARSERLILLSAGNPAKAHLSLARLRH